MFFESEDRLAVFALRSSVLSVSLLVSVAMDGYHSFILSRRPLIEPFTLCARRSENRDGNAAESRDSSEFYLSHPGQLIALGAGELHTNVLAKH